MRIATLAAALAVTAVTTATPAGPCTPKDAAAAGKALDRVNTWEQLHKSWKDWRQCDSGPTADGYTDAIMRLGVDWKNVDALAKGMGEDPQYHDFILAHVKSDAAKDDRPALYSRAKANCPKGLDTFCGEIAAATEGEKPLRTPDLLLNVPTLPPNTPPPKK
jgi:hypothetical protein